MTTLADLLSADRISVPLRAETLPEAAHILLECLVSAGAVSNPSRLRERVDEERPEDIVAMGDRAFLLHYRTDAVRDLAVALGTCPRHICRELGDGERQCARILLLVVAPPRQAARYLQAVGAFARFLSKAERVDAMLAQPDANGVMRLPELTSYEMREELSVSDLMSRRPLTVSPDTPLREAARDMVRAGVGGLPVVDAAGQVIGMLTERDLMRHLLNNYLHGGAVPRPGVEPATADQLSAVRDVMTRQVLCVSPEQPLAEVAALMTNKNVDRVPVVRDGSLVGFITRGDIVRKLIGS